MSFFIKTVLDEALNVTIRNLLRFHRGFSDNLVVLSIS